jgi:hypothetical protein
MNIRALFSNLGSAVGTASLLPVALGAVFLVDCRISAGRDPDKANTCYMVGLPIMGIGVAGKAGYETYNPALHAPELPKPKARTASKPAPKPPTTPKPPAPPTRKPDGRFAARAKRD